MLSASDVIPRSVPSVLVIDDEPDLRTLYELSLTREGYEVVTADSVAQSLAALGSRSFHAVVSDMQLPDGLGLEVLRFLSQAQRSERCVVITAHGSAENAVEALKAGAFDYLSKPVDLKQFRSVVAQAVKLSQSDAQITSQLKPQGLPQAISPPASLSDTSAHALAAIVGDSEVMSQLRARIAKVARSMAPVLVRGESGTGKELVARAIHACSHRSDGPFVAVNCSAIPESLLEAEFFGARKGSYTGAAADREGFFQAAHGGTLFLDEMGDLPLAMQAKLLRAIQERSVRPIGDTQELPVNVRIVSATHKDLNVAVAAGQFRQDLFYRINVIDMALPALRQRREDLPALVDCLLQRIATESGERVPQASSSFLAQLQALPLLGNVRELENLLHRAVALSDGSSLSLEDQEYLKSPAASNHASSLPAAAEASEVLPSDLQAHLDAQERDILVAALKDTGFNRTAAAARLGMSLRQIRYRMARLGIEADEGKS
ncbi:sigma-54 dependent transcriptional regulator [Variovorax sp. PCZ-1]|uniref:sigma-54-dependent transcriptional regulator n=1 Tax=Variovorax sp. PCZ-1 TaxID=2835533 RepID=UPI001BCE90F4|nr:sigma-54 dependent transcriptional regulator [Variovorax sp. PCZ-1]MBS7806389.1 sigma-54-dependent Fis family transcriptional regulator [Variovorax sp. PCZ-1]